MDDQNENSVNYELLGRFFAGETTPEEDARAQSWIDASPENRATWEQMLLYTYQQGIAHKHVAPEDIFPKGIMTSVVV